LGAVEGPIDAKLIPAAAGVSGCGPAYLFLLAE
jgi:pyrroline-5-carboxylate reductase